MSDLVFLKELVLGLGQEDLDWLIAFAQKRKAMFRPEITMRKTIIRATNEVE